jgi:uncharacterized protein YcbX
MHVAHLFVYPIKSCAALGQGELSVRPRGAAGDRRWMLVDALGRFVSGRKLAALVRLRAQPMTLGLRLDWGGDVLDVAVPAGAHGRCRVTVWQSEVDAALADPAASAWISQRVGASLRLVHMDAQAERWADPRRAGPAQPVSFADGYPWMLLSAAAIEALNRQISPPVPVQALRPNIVVDGCEAHAEDGWRQLRIGEVRFRFAKPCTRCVFTTVDPDGQPLKALKGYRLGADGVLFGVNLVAESAGTIRLGDVVEVLA